MSGMTERPRHDYDDDAVCTKCGFDGAEWQHWRSMTYEGREATGEEARAPSCTVRSPIVTVLPYMGKPVEKEKAYKPLTVHTDGVKRTRAIIVESNE